MIKRDPISDNLASRTSMVEEQIQERGIQNPIILEAMRRVPRDQFVNDEELAYEDTPLAIGHGQTISQPYIVGYMTQILNPKADDRVLEIGTGSGYQAAVLAEIVAEVYTIEVIPELAREAETRLKKLGYANIFLKNANGYQGWPEKAPFDSIIVTAAAEEIPPPLLEQLKEGGRMIVPVGPFAERQDLVLCEKKRGEISYRSVLPVAFVPFRTPHE